MRSPDGEFDAAASLFLHVFTHTTVGGGFLVRCYRIGSLTIFYLITFIYVSGFYDAEA